MTSSERAGLPSLGSRKGKGKDMTRKQRFHLTSGANGAGEVLEGLQDWLGMTPNVMMKIMAASPSVSSGYIDFSVTLAGGVLDAKFREQIALAVSTANQSKASIAFHSEIAKKIGLSEDEIKASQQCRSSDARKAVALRFVSELVVWRGQVSQATVLGIRNGGYGEAEIVEIAANVAVVTLANCFECIVGSQRELGDALGRA
jgi:AhpD family alkylhydroperoxidase